MYAINRYVRSKQIVDVSEAIQRFLEVDVLSRAGADVFTEPNVFRRAHCYSEAASKLLAKHYQSLKHLFDAISDRSQEVQEPGLLKQKARLRLVSLQRWRDFIRALRWIDEDVSEREAGLCFVWSRMCVADPRTRLGQLKENTLDEPGFLEALCRLAVLKALPTDEQIAAVGVKDAASYLGRMSAEEQIAFKKAHSAVQSWGDEPAIQPLARMLDHLIQLMINVVETDLGRPVQDGKLGVDEARRWVKISNLR